MNGLVVQQVSLAELGDYRYLYDPATGMLYHYLYDPSRGVYALVFATGWVPAPKLVNVSYGDKLRITAAYVYQGPAFSGTLYGAIGQKVVSTFDEILAAQSTISVTEKTSPATLQATVDIPITTAIAGGKNYAIYVKIRDSGGATKIISDYYENAVYVVGAEPAFSALTITDYIKV
ncbi:MAG TPA: hypothetical protein DIT43_01900 [Dehalococcoidia bacterium]|nr:hypothetical protein [Dehalococcoidia bacterium]